MDRVHVRVISFMPGFLSATMNALLVSLLVILPLPSLSIAPGVSPNLVHVHEESWTALLQGEWMVEL
jgi:hypothetical protein